MAIPGALRFGDGEIMGTARSANRRRHQSQSSSTVTLSEDVVESRLQPSLIVAVNLASEASA